MSEPLGSPAGRDDALRAAHLPLDFIAVHGSSAGFEVAHFGAGAALETPRPGARLVLHAGVTGAPLKAFEASGALCVPAARLLALLAPEDAHRSFASAREIGERYVRAASELRPNSEVLRKAAELLPSQDAVLRSLLHRAGASLAGASLAGAGTVETTGSVRTTPAATVAFPWPHLAPHELLDRAFEYLHDWQRATGSLPFEPRPGQVEMAHAVLDALLAEEDLVVEAGTGVGKTIAYALPMLLLATTRGGRFLVSTHTRNLQHQLVDRDLPELWRCFGAATVLRPDGTGRGLRFAKLLGRSNYVCRTALRRAMSGDLGPERRFALAQVLLWSLRTATGEIEEIAAAFEPRFLRELQSRREACQGRSCRGDPPCPVYAAREAARGADLVVVNHALLFSDAATEGNILGRFDGVVLDESHQLESVATEHLAVRAGRAQADALLPPLGRLVPAARALEHAEGLGSRIERYGAEVAAVRTRLHAFLDVLDANLPVTGTRRTRSGYHDGALVFEPVRAELEAGLAALGALANAASSLQVECLDLPPDDPLAGECIAALDLLELSSREMGAALEFVSAGNNEDWAFWLDFGTDGSTLREIVAAPLDVAREVQRLVGQTSGGAIYTSATLAVGGSFEYFMQRIGLSAATPSLVVRSPFDYTTQCFVAQASHLPAYTDPEFEPQAAEILAQIAHRTSRRCLVLLTSYAGLRKLHACLQRILGPGFPLFAQEVSGSRSQIAARFAATPGAMLLGTASFWEGVDFPGETLEVLALVKLPFLVPDEPLVAARCARLKQLGENPFAEYMLPAAVLRFAQGFGRLVRSRQDRGVVLLLDSRLGDRHYRRAFLEALPVRPESFEASATLVDRTVSWLETHAVR